MNRYELEMKLKEAANKGRLEGYNKGFEEGKKHPSFGGHPFPREFNGAVHIPSAPVATAPDGKYRCKVEVLRMQNMDAFEFRATLFIGRKYYNAKQIVSAETYYSLRNDRNGMTTYFNRWLDGAYAAMWKEFKKDVLFEFPNLDAEARTPQPRPGFFANLAGLRDPVPTLARPLHNEGTAILRREPEDIWDTQESDW